MEPYPERRAFHRMAVGCELNVQVAEGTALETCVVEDLSAVGIRFTSPREFAPDTRLSVTIHGGAEDRPFSADAVVVRCVANDDGYSVACQMSNVE